MLLNVVLLTFKSFLIMSFSLQLEGSKERFQGDTEVDWSSHTAAIWHSKNAFTFICLCIYLVSYLFNKAANIGYFCNVKRRFCVIFVSASEVGGGGMFQSRPGEDDVHRGLRNTALLSSLNKSSTFQHSPPKYNLKRETSPTLILIEIRICLSLPLKQY